MSFEAAQFIDRALKPNERGHYRCRVCGQTFSADGYAMHCGHCKGKG